MVFCSRCNPQPAPNPTNLEQNFRGLTSYRHSIIVSYPYIPVTYFYVSQTINRIYYFVTWKNLSATRRSCPTLIAGKTRATVVEHLHKSRYPAINPTQATNSDIFIMSNLCTDKFIEQGLHLPIIPIDHWVHS